MFQYETKKDMPSLIILTGNVSVAVFQSMKVWHELPHGDLEDFKQTHVLEKRVCDLWEENVLFSAKFTHSTWYETQLHHRWSFTETLNEVFLGEIFKLKVCLLNKKQKKKSPKSKIFLVKF